MIAAVQALAGVLAVGFLLLAYACWADRYMRRSEPEPVTPIIVTPSRFDVTTARRELVADDTLRIVAAVFPEQREPGRWS